MIRLLLALSLVACTDDPGRVVTPPPAPTPPPPAAGWVRDLRPEPSPEARGLYRRAVRLATRGDHAGVAALAKQSRTRYPGSRYAARLEPGASAAATVAALAALTAAFVAAEGGAKATLDQGGR